MNTNKFYKVTLGDGSVETLDEHTAERYLQSSADELIRVAKKTGNSVARLSRCNCPVSLDAVVSIKRVFGP